MHFSFKLSIEKRFVCGRIAAKFKKFKTSAFNVHFIAPKDSPNPIRCSEFNVFYVDKTVHAQKTKRQDAIKKYHFTKKNRNFKPKKYFYLLKIVHNVLDRVKNYINYSFK